MHSATQRGASRVAGRLWRAPARGASAPHGGCMRSPPVHKGGDARTLSSSQRTVRSLLACVSFFSFTASPFPLSLSRRRIDMRRRARRVPAECKRRRSSCRKVRNCTSLKFPRFRTCQQFGPAPPGALALHHGHRGQGERRRRRTKGTEPRGGQCVYMDATLRWRARRVLCAADCGHCTAYLIRCEPCDCA